MEFENIKLDINDQVATIALNKPERLNACSLGMADDIYVALDKLEENNGVVIGAVLNAVEEKDLETQEGLRSLNFSTDQLMTTPGRV